MRNFLFAGAAVAALAIPAAVQAQQITSGIEGRVVTDAGQPIVGAQVTVTDTRTGATRTLTTSNSGFFNAVNLQTGGPYTVSVDADGYEGQTLDGININLQGNTTLTFSLASGAGDIVVTAAAVDVGQRAIGPGQSFDAETLATFPTISRDIRDFIRIDPRVSLDRANEVDRISCLGGNDRSNAFSIDGSVQADVFGLNGTPFGSRNTLPLPFDAVRETSVEFAPFDVEYGQFTGCAINVITKSGENDFHGSAFFTYTGNDLTGDRIAGQDFTQPNFQRKRWGATLSGPIIKDRLFFFGAYEETDLGDSFDVGPADGGFPNPQAFVTTAQFNEFSQILQSVYGIDTGPIARALPETSRRFFGRLDWNINDKHRFEATYQRLEEENVEDDDLSVTGSIFTGLNSFEVEGTQSDYYSLRLYSTWNDTISTELRASRGEIQDIQGPVGGGEAQSDNPIPRIIVGVENNGAIGLLQAGPGFSRASNELRTTINQLKAKADIRAGDHLFTLGAEFNQLKVFNLFAQNTTGTFVFQNFNDLRNGITTSGTSDFPNPQLVTNNGTAGVFGAFTASGDINDAAARFTRNIFSAYAQDEWQITPQLQILAGVRVDWFDGGAPPANPNFLQRYGFTNAVPFSKFDPLLLPRIGFTYNFENDGFFRNSRLTGGVGIFTGGDPTVYFSNAFSNNGFNVGRGQTGVTGCFPVGTPADVVENGRFTGIPQCVVQGGSTEAARGLADTQSTDPNFQQPTVLRANIGFGTRFGFGGGFFDDWRLQADYIYSRFRNPLNFVDLSQVVDPRLGLNGFTVDGRPIYRAIDPTRPGCGAQLQGTGGTPPTFTNVTAACFGTGRDDEIQLTNGPAYNSHVASFVLSKNFGRGVFTDGGGVSVNLGYAFTEADNNRYNFSATATSSFDIVAAFDRQNPAVARSEFETKHNFTFALNFREQFVQDYETQLGFVFVARSGRPYSVVFDDGAIFNDSASGVDNALLYVPTGPTDPNVVYVNTVVRGVTTQTAEQTRDQLNAFIDSRPCVSRFRGRTIPRNTCTNDWFFDLDLRISQMLPGPGRLFGVEDRIQVFADFDNFLNLIDDGANVFRNRQYTVPVANTNFDAQGRYQISDFRLDDNNNIQTTSSLWRIQLGVRYEF